MNIKIENLKNIPFNGFKYCKRCLFLLNVNECDTLIEMREKKKENKKKEKEICINIA